MDELIEADDVRRKLRESCERRGSAAAWAKWAYLSPSYVSDVLTGRREPGARLLMRLGMERVVRYRVVAGADRP